MDTAQSTALTVPQRAAVALKADQRRKNFIELAKASAEIVAITNTAGYQECHAARMRLKTARVEITKEGKEVRDDAVKFQKGVIALEQELVALIEPEEKRLDAIQTEHDQRVEREKQAKIDAENRRIADIQVSINEFRNADAGMTVLSGSVVISTRLENVKEHPIGDFFAEFKNEAEQAKVDVVIRLTKLREAALTHEAEQRQIRADREELELRRKEEDERQRKAAEAEAAAIRQRAIDDAARQATIDEQERQARLKREGDDRKAQEARDEQDRVARIAREADQRRLQEEADRLAAERRKVEEAQREQREADEAKARAEREAQEKREAEARAKVRAEQEAREAAAREEKRKADELLDLRGLLVTVCDRCEGKEFAGIARAINAYFAKTGDPRRGEEYRKAA